MYYRNIVIDRPSNLISYIPKEEITMKQLIENVVKWGADRGLDKVGHLAQAKYTLKETAELLDAYADQDIAKINDAIGDIFVTLIVGASNDDDFLNTVEDYLLEDPESFNSACRTIYGEFHEEYINLIKSGFGLLKEHPCDITYTDVIFCLDEILSIINDEFDQDLSLKDCLQLAYDEIKNRKGKLVNGQFIKE